MQVLGKQKQDGILTATGAHRCYADALDMVRDKYLEVAKGPNCHSRLSEALAVEAPKVSWTCIVSYLVLWITAIVVL